LRIATFGSFLLLLCFGNITIEGRRESFVSTLKELLVENSTLLINFNDWRSSEVGDDAASFVSRGQILLIFINIAGVFLGKILLVANGDMGVDHGIGS